MGGAGQAGIAKKVAPGVYTRLGDLDSASFTNAVMADQKTAKQHISDLITAARALHTASKTKPQPPANPNPLPDLMTKQAAVATPTPPAPNATPTSAEDWVVAAIKANACTVLNAGCFAAGTKLLTRSGWRAVETIRPGDEVLSRSEHDWSALAEWKRVEERFERTGCILHVHVGGEVIRTTPEHPFFVQGEGWKQAGALTGGDRIATLSGEWVGVEEVFDTQEWEPVYNLRVADHHTYFVGDEGWGWAAWVHNEYKWTQSSKYKETGAYYTVTDRDGGSGYSQPWWQPNKLPPTQMNTPQTSPCVDRITGLGDRLKASAQAFADGWKDEQLASERYGPRIQFITDLLQTINDFLPTNLQLTLDQIDKQGMRFPVLSGNQEYAEAVKQFWFHRSVSIGWYVHTKVENAFRNEPGLSSTPPPAPGPDFTYLYTMPGETTPRTVYFEILPDTASSRRAHAKRGMKTFLYRAVYYNRNVINSAGSQEPGWEAPNEPI